jgi:archaellum component FlaC
MNELREKIDNISREMSDIRESIDELEIELCDLLNSDKSGLNVAQVLSIDNLKESIYTMIDEYEAAYCRLKAMRDKYTAWAN